MDAFIALQIYFCRTFKLQAIPAGLLNNPFNRVDPQANERRGLVKAAWYASSVDAEEPLVDEWLHTWAESDCPLQAGRQSLSANVKATF